MSNYAKMVDVFKSTDPAIKRKRAGVACLTCRERKVRCNVEECIPCYNCKTDKTPCSIAKRKRQKPRPSKKSNANCDGVDRAESRPPTPNTPSICYAQSLEDYVESEQITSSMTLPQSPSSESHGTPIERELTAWLLSCPVPLSPESSDHLLDTIIGTGLGEEARKSTGPFQKQTFQKCFRRHFGPVIDDQPTTPMCTPTSSFDTSCNFASSWREASNSHSTRNCHEHIRHLMKMCTDLTSLSYRLSNIISNSSATNCNITPGKGTVENSLRVDDTKITSNEVLLVSGESPTSWDVTDDRLFDEPGVPGFDYWMDILSSEIE